MTSSEVSVIEAKRGWIPKSVRKAYGCSNCDERELCSEMVDGHICTRRLSELAEYVNDYPSKPTAAQLQLDVGLGINFKWLMKYQSSVDLLSKKIDSVGINERERLMLQIQMATNCMQFHLKNLLHYNTESKRMETIKKVDIRKAEIRPSDIAKYLKEMQDGKKVP